MRKACQLILALLACPAALALPPEPGPEIELFIAGSSAQDESLENLMRLTPGENNIPHICEEGSLDIYRGVIQGTSKRVYYCLTSGHIEGV